MSFALFLSITFVIVVASLARGTNHLRGALNTPEPTDVTVIALVEPRLATGAVIRDITFLRKSTNGTENDRGTYAYLVKDSSESIFFLTLGWNPVGERWSMSSFERLHGDVSDLKSETRR